MAEGSEGLPEGSEGLPEGPEGLPGGWGVYVRTYRQNFTPFYRTLLGPLPKKLMKSYCSGPKFFPRPNLHFHPISSTSWDATPHIFDPEGLHQSPIIIDTTPKLIAKKHHGVSSSLALLL